MSSKAGPSRARPPAAARPGGEGEPAHPEQAIQAAELRERLAAIVECSDDAIVSKDLDGIIRSWNRGAERIFGYTADEVVGKHVSLLAAPDRVDEIPRILDRIRRGERVEHFETRRRTKDGRILAISLTVSPVRDASGSIVGASKIARDITAQKAAEEANRELQRELMLLIEASGALLASPHSEDVLKRIVDTAAQFIAADAYAVWRNRDGNDVWRLVTSRGLSDQYERQTTESGTGGSMPAEPLAVEDVQQSPLLRSRAHLYEAEGIRSMLAVPLWIHGRVGGTLVFYYRTPRQFDKEVIRLAGALANLAAAALGTATLYDLETEARTRAEEAGRRATFLADAGALLSSSLDYDATLTRVAQAAVPVFADWCGVDLADGKTLRRVAVAHQDPKKVEFAKEFYRRYPPGETDPVLVALREGQSVLIEDVTEEMITASALSEQHLSDVRALGIRSVVVVPMLTGGRALGTLSFVTSESQRRYSAADLEFAEELARRAATAIDNARLHRDIRDKEERLRLAQSVAGIGTWEWDLTSGAVRWSPEIFALLGLREGEVEPSFQAWMEHIFQEDVERIRSEASAAILTGSSLNTEFRVRRRDGQLRWVLSRAKVFQDASGRATRMLGLNIDVTDRKAVEQKTEFLLGLEDAIRSLSDPVRITWAAARLLGRHLGVNRCAYADVESDENTFNIGGDYTDGVPSIVGRFTADQFGPDFSRLCREGRPWVISDTETDPRVASARDAYRATQIRAVISVPLHRDGKFVAGMGVHQSSPRVWRDDEVELVRQVASRCWESIERARVERELRDSEARFRVMADSAPVLVWVADNAGNCTWFNRPWLEFTGRTLEQESGFGWTEGIHPDDRQRCIEAGRRAIERKESFRIEYRLRRFDGQYRWILHHGVPLTGHDTTAASSYVGSCIDITDRIAAESALRESEARFRQLADAIPAFVWVADADGSLSYFNSRWYEYTGLSEEQARGYGWASVLHPDDAERVRQAWDEARAAERPYAVDSRYRAADGNYRWYMARALPVRDASGRVAHWFGSSTDIEEAKNTEEELRQANAGLEEFAWVASHDLQEPLRMINIYTQLLLKKSAADAELDQYGAFIRQGVIRMEQLIHDLLSYSRTIHADQRAADAVELSAALDDAITTLQNQIEDSDAEIVAGPLPRVCGDVSQLSLVFQNLLSNAIKYRLPETRPRITISSSTEGSHAVVAVRDNGVGFDQKYAEQIFGLFKRLYKNEYPGTGLGLAICHRIIERGGGRIWAEGRPGEGATFWFTLPLA